MHLRILPIFFVLIIAACTSEKQSATNTGFVQIDAEISGINFSNDIVENDTLNYFDFPYLYLGAGVSAGDINNDGLPDLYFTGNLVPNKLYLNKGGLQFEDITESAGISGDDRWYSGTTMVDINHDGYLDIYLSVSGKFGNTANQLFINNGNNTFTESAESYGIADTGASIQSTFFDYDNDGLLDLFVANYPNVMVSMGNRYYKEKMDENKFEDSGHLYKNQGNGKFVDVTVEAGVQNFGLTLGLVATDFNNDGHVDLYLSNDFNVPDYLYQNNGDGTFKEISEKATRHTSMFGMGIDAADFNNDGYTDLLQVDMTPADYKRSKTNMASMNPESFYEAVDFGFNYQYMQNSLQLNNGPNRDGDPIFSDIARFAGMATTDWSWGALFADFDNDGNKDVFVTNGVKRDVNNNDVNAAYDKATFFGRESNPDFNLMPSTPISNFAFQNKGDFSFSNVTEAWGLDQKGFSNGFTYTDLDGDGDLDLVINNMDGQATIAINQTQKTDNHFLRIKLKGERHNPFALGAKVVVKSGETQQLQELTLSRGYQSSVEPILHFGLGSEKTVNKIEVIWPNGKLQTIENITADRSIEIPYDDSSPLASKTKVDNPLYFEDITESSKIDFLHKEDIYNDFAFEPLLPHKNSQLGPALTVGDINGDGLEDFFVGNAEGSPAAMYLQKDNGEFEKLSGPWEKDLDLEDTGALLFDADGDSDLDLYVVSGGNNKLRTKVFYQDRLYVNTADGFKKAEKALPEIKSSGLKVISADYDNDGDLDLFVGGRIVPGQYPFPAKSYILRNEGGKDQSIRYVNVTDEMAPELLEAGLVTSALWDDFDQDGKIDLILTGEWMPIRFFKNLGHRFKEVTQDLGFGKSQGWWYSLQKMDVDADGDMDYLAGNLGLNYKYRASEKAPFEVYANDFDENGSMDIVLSYEKYGTKLPLRGRECSSQQVPAIKQRFKTFESFANADLKDIYGEKMLDLSLHYAAQNFAHQWIENRGDGTYAMHNLPNRAQFSSINSIQEIDYNGDEYPDVVVAGNLYQSEVETPRNDSSVGMVLIGGPNGLELVAPHESGLIVTGDVRNMALIKLSNNNLNGLLFAINNDSLKLKKVN